MAVPIGVPIRFWANTAHNKRLLIGRILRQPFLLQTGFAHDAKLPRVICCLAAVQSAPHLRAAVPSQTSRNLCNAFRNSANGSRNIAHGTEQTITPAGKGAIPGRNERKNPSDPTKMTSPALPFFLHAATELLASSTFLITPESHIPSPSPQATLVSQLLGGSLLHSSLLAIIFAFRDVWDDTARRASLAFAIWHVFPCYRAVVRLSTKMDGPGGGKRDGQLLGGPSVHLATHGALLLMFLLAGIQGWDNTGGRPEL